MPESIDGDSIIYSSRRFCQMKGRKLTLLNPGRLLMCGVVRVRDFFDVDGRTRTQREAFGRGLPWVAAMEWKKCSQIIEEACKKYHLIVGEDRSFTRGTVATGQIKLCQLSGSSIKQGAILKAIAKARHSEPTKHQRRIETIVEIDEEEWPNAYKRIKQHAISIRQRSFAYRQLVMGLYTNKDYFRFDYKQSPKCTFCNEPRQDFEHLFLACPTVNSFRNAVAARWPLAMPPPLWLSLPLSAESVSEKAMAYLTIELNAYVHRTNWLEGELSLQAFKATVRQSERIESKIALSRDKIMVHAEKWQPILELM